MVTQIGRPQRASAVEGVKRATQMLTSKAAARTASAGTAKAAPAPKERSKRIARAAEPDSGDDSSDLSDLDEEEQAKMDSEESEAEEPSESEAEADNTSDYDEGFGTAKRKRGPRVSKKTTTTPKAKRAKQTNTAASKARTKASTSRKAAPVRSKGRQVGNKEELAVQEDNKIFNDVKNIETDLQTTAQEWVEHYQENPGMAMAQLVNSIMRSAACNSSIDEVQVLDHDSVTDVLDEVQERMKTVAMPSYPLVSRAASYRRFARRLCDWMEKLFICADEADIVYDDTMMETLTAWISAMSSSALRSLRHTSTYIVLQMVEQINRMTRNNAKELQSAISSRDAEKRKASAANKVRLRDLEAKVKDGNQIKKQLKGFHQELLDTVFIHRYRDSDSNIRADCMSELGRWMKTYPDQYLSTSYFRYFGWMLSDQDAKVRLVTIKALDSLYTRHDYEGPLQQFTERFLPRMTEMATIDVDLQVRVAAISTLTHIDQLGALDEEERDSLALHIFDIEPKVRSAVAGFIKGVLDEQLQETEGSSEKGEVKKLRWKYTAELLARLASQLDAKGRSEQLEAEAALSTGEVAPSRIAMAISASLNIDEELHDWKSLLELLLYDHTQQQVKPRGRKSIASQAPLKEAYRLLPEEETILLEVLSYLVLHYKTQSSTGKDEADMESYSAITRDLIPVMGQLFNKYKTEAGRINEVLTVVRLLKMDTFVEFQELNAFEVLWDNVIDQFQRHVEVTLLNDAVKAISAMNTMSSMSHINTAKLTALQDSLIQTLRESVADMYSVENDHMNEEDVHRLTACTRRIKYLIQCTDLSSDLNSISHQEEVESGNGGQTSSSNAWNILLSFVKRGLRGDAAEESMIADAIVTLSLATMWSLRNVLAITEVGEKEEASSVLCDQRNRVIEALNDLIKPEATLIVPLLARRAAFQQLVDLYILFASAGGERKVVEEEDAEEELPSNPLRLECGSAAQKTLSAFVRSELVRYAQDVQTTGEAEAEAEAAGDDVAESDNDSQTTALGKSGRHSALPELHRQMDFVAGISHYLGAIRLGVVHARYSIPLLSRYGRMGSVYDACLRVLVENIRLVGIEDGKPELACSVIIESLWEAHGMLCEDADNWLELAFVNLAKMLSSALVVRGAQLAILKGVSGEAVKDMHNKGMRLVLEKLAKNEDEQLQPRILCFFKALCQLLVSVGPREAVAIKKDMDNLIAHYNIEVPITSKAWDAIRQYEKRLVTIASKSDSVKRHVEATRAAVQANGPEQSTANLSRKEVEEKSDQADEQGDITMNADYDLDEQSVGDETRQEQQLDLTLSDDHDEEEDASGEDED